MITKVDIVSGIFAVCGLLGAIVHGALSSVQTPVLTNQLLSVWFAMMLFFTALQVIQLHRSQPQVLSLSRSYILELLYWMLIVITALISFIGYLVAGPKGGQSAAAAWSFLITVVSGFGVYSTYTIRTNAVKVGDGEKSTSEVSSLTRCALCGNGFLRFVHVFFSVLLCNGAIIAAQAYSYKSLGALVPVTLIDGRNVQLHMFCDGPKNSSLPVIFVFASPAHGVVDYYGFQYYLTQQGRRVCTMDHLGFGNSDDLLSNAADPYVYIDSLLKNSGETGPFILVANGGGGPPVTQYASQNPTSVAALVYMFVYPPGIEFKVQAAKKGFSSQQTVEYKNQQLMQRLSLTQIILGMALPWGLMPLFVPMSSVSPSYYPSERRSEFRVQLWKNAMWVNQYWGIQYQSTIDELNDPYRDIRVGKPVMHLLCRLADSQVLQTCLNQKLPADLCETSALANNMTLPLQINMTLSLNSSAQFFYDTADNCSIEGALTKPKFTADLLLQAIQNVTLP